MFNVTIEFDQVPQDDVAAYKVYGGDAVLGTVPKPTAAGPIQFSFQEESEGIVQVRVSAVDATANESVKSEELNVALDVPPVGPNKPRLIAIVWTA